MQSEGTLVLGPKPSAWTLKILRVLAAIAILSAGVAILAHMTRATFAKSDFISYWAASQQLAHHQNPYDGDAILRLENAAGFTGHQPFLMRNPPWGLFLALPLAIFTPASGSFVWSIAMLGCLILSIHLLRNQYSCGRKDLHLAGYVFPPALFCLMEGQTGLFLLLGIALFLYFENSRPHLAGVALLLLSIKPHLFLPFGIVLLVWCVASKSYSVLAGASFAFVTSLGLATVFDRHIFADYGRMLAVSKIQDDYIPTLSQLLRVSIHLQSAWIQLVPVGIGCLWATIYFWHRRSRWNWSTDGMIVLLVSVMVSPYAWFADQSVLLSAILIGIYTSRNPRIPLYLFGCLAAICIVEMSIGLAPRSYFYVWTTPAWLAWFLWSRQVRARQR